MAVDINQLHPTLKKAYENAKAEYLRDHPTQPRPRLTFTHRSAAVQNAFFAQGRMTPAQVNLLRKAAGLPAIGAAEAGRRITNAKGGQSPHNYLPALALDVAFVKADGKTLDWSLIHFQRFAPYMTKHAGIEWGGAWPNFPDAPHFQLRNWRVYATPA
ncbi:M15 family metallopeptidase [Hymenobacter koreensis]|uniref:Peptidase M15C domain-containing protein n=1 Tax=Hymenobacter koreensis TaxID=1084523 RepID=A0ABP8JPG7_9BACT